MKKKLISVLLATAMVVSLAACGGGGGDSTPSTSTEDAAADKADGADGAEEAGDAEEESKPAGEDTSAESAAGSDISGVTLEVAVTYTGDQASTFNSLVDKFEEEYGCTVNVAEYGNDYENTMKTRMAANELPDIFQTHGWSILRYKEYLMDLKDQPWVADYDESALGVIQDDDGAIYVLMISELVNATLVNKTVCDAAGVDYYAIHTYDDLSEACEKIKASGVTPMGTNSNPGVLANYAGTFVSYDGELYQDSAAMLDGSYDWENYKSSVIATLSGWMDKGYYY